MDRRNALKHIGMGLSGVALGNFTIPAAMAKPSDSGIQSDHKIAKIRYYDAPDYHKPLLIRPGALSKWKRIPGSLALGKAGQRTRLNNVRGC